MFTTTELTLADKALADDAPEHLTAVVAVGGLAKVLLGKEVAVLVDRAARGRAGQVVQQLRFHIVALGRHVLVFPARAQQVTSDGTGCALNGAFDLGLIRKAAATLLCYQQGSISSSFNFSIYVMCWKLQKNLDFIAKHM